MRATAFVSSLPLPTFPLAVDWMVTQTLRTATRRMPRSERTFANKVNFVSQALAVTVAILVNAPCRAEVSSGTGFAVTTSKLVTNHHVVKGCSQVAVVTRKGIRKAKVVAFDEDADLALLHSLGVSSAIAPLRYSEPHLGERVGVFGFPLAGTLTSTGNFTDGVVSALRGLGEDATNIQFTAPIQPGNSGGPLLDNSGNVIGVVVAKLNVLMQVKETGDVAQNVNFAVSPTLLKAFLAENKVPFTLSNSAKTIGSERLAAAAQEFTYLLVCESSSNTAVAQAKPPVPSGRTEQPSRTPPVETTPPSPSPWTPPNVETTPPPPSPPTAPSGDSRQPPAPRLTFDWDAPHNDTGKSTRYMGLHILHPYRPVLLAQENLIVQLRRCLFTDSRSHFPGMEDIGGGWWRSCQAERRSYIPLDDFMKAKTVTVSVNVDNLITRDVSIRLNGKNESISIPLSDFSDRLLNLYRETRGAKRLRVSVRLSEDWLSIPKQNVTGWVTED